jgi:hypothetical protein
MNSGGKSAERARMRPGKDYVACAEVRAGGAGPARQAVAGGWPGRGDEPSESMVKMASRPNGLSRRKRLKEGVYGTPALQKCGDLVPCRQLNMEKTF